MKTKLVIGSRGSKLALWQSEWVKSQLELRFSNLEIRIEIIKTTGDTNTQQPLTVIGGKGVFTKELEEALSDGRVDLAVHSLKDLPTILPDGLILASITEREDPRDALVFREDSQIEKPSLATLPNNAIVGTSSQRRMAQLKASRPDVQIKDLRGNVDTRIRKLDEGEYDAIILASAGLKRLGLAKRISATLALDEMLPAVGQGALGLETRANDSETIKLVQSLNHEQTNISCTAERTFLRALGGGCQLPIAGHAIVHDKRLLLSGMLASESFDKIVRNKIDGSKDEAKFLGQTLAEMLTDEINSNHS